jgi:hypothetical protein
VIVRGFVVLGVLVGCYSPSAPAGVPCDPAASNCPAGEACVAQGDGHVCGPPGSGEVELDAPLGADAPVDGAGTERFEYVATIAECLNPAIPDPAECKARNGAAELVIDLRDSTTNEPWQAYVRFDLDNAFAGKTITNVTLRLVATDANNAPGPESGEVWEVTPFTADSLDILVPLQLADAPLAGSQGAVVNLQPIEWPIPARLVAPGGSVFLGLASLDENGVNYSNLAGPAPPRLLVDTR